jgi:hypothetical protein
MRSVQQEGQAIARDIALSVLLAVLAGSIAKQNEGYGEADASDMLQRVRGSLDQAMWSTDPSVLKAACIHLDILFSTAIALGSTVSALT